MRCHGHERGSSAGPHGSYAAAAAAAAVGAVAAVVLEALLLLPAPSFLCAGVVRAYTCSKRTSDVTISARDAVQPSW
jgi:hypothetical protein